MDTIQKLVNCEFGQETFHSDGEGHVQVQHDSHYGFDTPRSLIEQIELEGLWPEVFEMAKTKDEEWILNITRYFSNTDHFATTCFVEFLSILSSREAQIQLLQDSPSWLWDEKSLPVIKMVIGKAEKLAKSTPPESLGNEIDLSILNGVISKLEAMRNNTD